MMSIIAIAFSFLGVISGRSDPPPLATVEVFLTVTGESLGRFEKIRNVRHLKEMIEEREGTPFEFIKILEGTDIKSDDDTLNSESKLNMLKTVLPDA